MISQNDTDFAGLIRQRAEKIAAEYYKLLHEQKRIEVQLERNRKYLQQLNGILESEGQGPIALKEPPKGSPVGKAGNRALDFPVRKVEWEGMTLIGAVQGILEASPNDIQHADVIAHRIYEIQSPKDVKRVKQSLVSTLRRGGKAGMWEALRGNRYKAKNTVAQERLINA